MKETKERTIFPLTRHLVAEIRGRFGLMASSAASSKFNLHIKAVTYVGSRPTPILPPICPTCYLVVISLRCTRVYTFFVFINHFWHKIVTEQSCFQW